MTPDPDFGYEQFMAELVGGVIDVVASQPGQSEPRRSIQRQTAVHSVMGFQPRDAVETMLAGHCVIYDRLLRDGAGETLRAAEQIRLRSRPVTLASGKMFLSSLAVLLRLQNRPGDKIVVLPSGIQTEEPAPPPAEPVPVDEPELPTQAPGFGGAFRLSDAGSALPDATPRASLASRLRGSVSHAALLIAAQPDELIRGTLFVRQTVQAGTDSTARTQRAMAPLGAIATGISSPRHASTA